MAHDIKYIDKLTRTNLKDFGQMPETNWNKFQSDFSGKLSPEFSSNTSAYGIIKNIVRSVVGLSILATGIFMYSEKEDGKIQVPVCKTATTKQLNVSDDVSYVVKHSSDIGKTENIELSNKNANSNQTENVIIRVEVPVYKKIEVVKEVIINDSVQN